MLIERERRLQRKARRKLKLQRQEQQRCVSELQRIYLARKRRASFVARENALQEAQCQALDEAETRLGVRAELLRMFDMFDEDGGGAIDPEEMYRIFDEAGLLRDPSQCQRLRKHFQYMDSDGNGIVDFSEFEQATIGAHNQSFKTLQEEEEAAANSNDLFLLMTELRRQRLVEQAQKERGVGGVGAEETAFATLCKLVELDVFALNVDHENDERFKTFNHRSTRPFVRRSSLVGGAGPKYKTHTGALPGRGAAGSGPRAPWGRKQLPPISGGESARRVASALCTPSKVQLRSMRMDNDLQQAAAVARLAGSSMTSKASNFSSPATRPTAALAPLTRGLSVGSSTTLSSVSAHAIRRRRKACTRRLGGTMSTSCFF